LVEDTVGVSEIVGVLSPVAGGVSASSATKVAINNAPLPIWRNLKGCD
jgi:hypothetical protein